MDHENQELSPTVSQSGEPQEVVLRYEAPVTPIVERYMQSDTAARTAEEAYITAQKAERA